MGILLSLEAHGKESFLIGVLLLLLFRMPLNERLCAMVWCRAFFSQLLGRQGWPYDSVLMASSLVTEAV